MTIQVGEKLPSVTFMHMSDAGPAPISTEELFGGKIVALFAVPGAVPRGVPIFNESPLVRSKVSGVSFSGTVSPVSCCHCFKTTASLFSMLLYCGLPARLFIWCGSLCTSYSSIEGRGVRNTSCCAAVRFPCFFFNKAM